MNNITITLEEYFAGKDGLVDLETCSPNVRGDYRTRNENILAGKTLCKRCDGTGNQFFSMYSKCDLCRGTGVEKQ